MDDQLVANRRHASSKAHNKFPFVEFAPLIGYAGGICAKTAGSEPTSFYRNQRQSSSLPLLALAGPSASGIAVRRPDGICPNPSSQPNPYVAAGILPSVTGGALSSWMNAVVSVKGRGAMAVRRRQRPTLTRSPVFRLPFPREALRFSDLFRRHLIGDGASTLGGDGVTVDPG